jgi:hypothetical protein
MSNVVETQTEVSVPSGRLWNDDVVSTDDYGLFENLDALVKYVWDNAQNVIGLFSYIPKAIFISDKNYIALEYIDEDCDHDEPCADEDADKCLATRTVREEEVYFRYTDLTRIVR